MDQSSKIFKGNGSDLMGKVVENSIKDAEENAEMTFDMEGCDELADLFPAWWSAVEAEIRAVYQHYCQVADRLNVGPSANLNRFQFIHMMTDAGMLSPDFKIPKVNLVYQKELVEKEKRLRYEHFFDAVAFMGQCRFPHVHKIKNARSHYHRKGAALYYMLLEFMLPLAANVAAVTYSQKKRNTSERRHTEVRSSQWMERWRNIEVLREIMRTDKRITDHFGVPDDLEEESEESEEDKEEEEEQIGNKENVAASGAVSLLHDGGEEKKREIISSVGDLAEQVIALHESLVEGDENDLSVATVDGFKLVSAANDILAKAKLLEERDREEEQVVGVTDIEDAEGGKEEEKRAVNVR